MLPPSGILEGGSSDPADWKGFLDRLGPETLRRLTPTRALLAEPVDYGA